LAGLDSSIGGAQITTALVIGEGRVSVNDIAGVGFRV
jgi:hypothetical protein